MAVATKPKPKPTAQEASTVTVSHPAEVRTAAEDILAGVGSLDHRFTSNELTIFSLMNVDTRDPHEVHKLVSNAVTLRDLSKAAGTQAEFAAANADVDAAEKARAEQLPALEQVIAKAQATITALQDALSVAQSKRAPMAAAREQLRSEARLWPWQRHDLRHARNFAELGTSQRIGEIKQRLSYCDGILAMGNEPPLTPPAIPALRRGPYGAVVDERVPPIVRYCQVSRPDLLTGNGNRVDEAKWRDLCEQVKVERAALLLELEPLQARLDADLQQAESMCDYHLNRLQ